MSELQSMLEELAYEKAIIEAAQFVKNGAVSADELLKAIEEELNHE